MFWVDIPVLDMNRAVDFYSKIFSFHCEDVYSPIEPHIRKMKIFKLSKESIPLGAFICSDEYQPSKNGVLVTFKMNFSKKIEKHMDDLKLSSFVLKKFDSPELGQTIHILDSEGNRIGIHSF